MTMLYDSLDGALGPFADNPLTIATRLCRLLGPTRPPLPACLAALVSAATAVQLADASYWSQQWLQEGGTPDQPFQNTAPAIAALEAAARSFLTKQVDTAIAGQETELAEIVGLTRAAERSKHLFEGLLDIGSRRDPGNATLERALIGAILHVNRAAAPDARGKRVLAAETPVMASRALFEAIDKLKAALADIIEQVVHPAFRLANKRDFATGTYVLPGKAWIDEDDGSVHLGAMPHAS